MDLFIVTHIYNRHGIRRFREEVIKKKTKGRRKKIQGE